MIQLSQGAGGKLMNDLIKREIISNIKKRRIEGGIGLDEFDDGATIPFDGWQIAVSSDGHIVDPPFFPGGDIGKLAVCGAINDLAMMGARPIALTDTIIVEEGFPVEDLSKIVRSMSETAEGVGAAIIHGDFKVMPKGKLDKIVISTTGIGTIQGAPILDSGLREGDIIIVTGPIGDHGVAIASLRSGVGFATTVVSDVSPLWEVMRAAMSAGRVTAAKDPTRGGIAMALNEIAERSKVSIWIREDEIPIRREVQGACEMLGLDPLELTCEGRAVIGVDKENADAVLEAVKRVPEGKEAKIIGTVKAERPGYVIMETAVGGRRVINPPLGEPTPRIC
ncbi:MAG: hydrogenase expression/formation protein HypE [Candidatus Verstraetearchaeota archaeon]|nr:hydrogenase expression/formation protein HypE [Candidatus Verstraetearchaeota archaeon]